MNTSDGGKGKGNRKGIGIEIARSRSDLATFKQAEENGAKLTAWILQRYGWGTDRVKQHADFSKKNCPHRTRELGWNRFIGMVEKYLNQTTKEITNETTKEKKVPIKGKVTTTSLNIRPTAGVTRAPIGKLKTNDVVDIIGIASNGWYQIDFGGKIGYVSNLYVTITGYANDFPVVDESKKKVFRITNEIKNPNSRYYTINKLNVIETSPNNIEIRQFYGKPIRQIGKSGINGTWFDTAYPASTRSTWGLAINDGKAIGENAHTNHWDGTKRGTLSYFGKGQVYNQYINHMNEFKNTPIWAIGGLNMIAKGNPHAFDLKLEKVPNDWARRTYHTAIAYKDGKIFLITSQEEVYLNSFKNMIAVALDPDSCINLDGGGSTQMAYGGKFFGSSTRKLNNGIVLKKL